jgi:enamine deaminase RidA (YjgF/YER057c/UK114 family)
MMIERLPGGQHGRSRASAWGETVWAVATSPDVTLDLAGQVQAALAALEQTLHQMGSDKHHILSAQVFLADMAAKVQADALWDAWIGEQPAHWPQRACFGVDLGGALLIEITVTALKHSAAR